MALVNNILNVIFDVIFYPFHELKPIWGLVFASLVSGLLILIVFKRTSSQERIKENKGRLKAHLLELLLYKDDIRLSFEAMRNGFGANFRYVLYMAKPMLVLTLPIVLIIIHLAARYEHRPLRPGEKAVISLKSQDESALNEIILESSDGIRIETPPLRIYPEHQIDWRIQAVQAGEWDLTFRRGNENVSKKLIVGSNLTRLAPRRNEVSVMAQLLQPAERPIAHSSFAKEIRVHYPAREIFLWNWKMNWLILYVGLSIVAGYAMKGVFSVEI